MWKVVGFLVVFTLDCGFADELPSFIKPCNRSDPDIYKCVEENIENLRPKLKDGISELFIPSLDPLVIPNTCVNEEDQVKVTFKDIHIHHANDFHLDQFDIDLVKHRVNISVKFPWLRIKSTYNVNGRILVLKLDENGPADGNYTNFQVHLALKGTPIEKDTKEYLSWEKEHISINIEHSHVVLEKLFGNHTELGQETNKVINENIDLIISDLQPVLQRVLSDFVFGVVNKLFSKYSVKELFAH